MTRVRRNGRTAVATVATLSAATLLVGATGAMAGGTPTAAVPATTAAETTTSDTCNFPVQKLKVALILTLRSETDNDIKKIKVRATNKNETGSFYKAGVTLKSIRIEVYKSDGDVGTVQVFNKASSPAIVGLNAAGNGAEVDKVRTVTKFKLKNGSTATASCSVRITDDN